MERLSCDEVEDRMNTLLGDKGEQSLLPVIDHNGREVAIGFEGIDFFEMFNENEHPDIYNSLRDRIILHIGGTHVRVMEAGGDVLSFISGLKTPIKIIQGPPLVEPSLEDLRKEGLID